MSLFDIRVTINLHRHQDRLVQNPPGKGNPMSNSSFVPQHEVYTAKQSVLIIHK